MLDTLLVIPGNNLSNTKEMNKPSLLLGLLIQLVFGCHYNQYSESQKILEKSISIHDEVMPKMDEIVSLQKKLNTLLPEFENNPKQTGTINKAIINLESAHSGMMNWMRNMKSVPMGHNHTHHENHANEHYPPDEMLTIQKAQLDEIINVRNDIINSIEEAKKLLK